MALLVVQAPPFTIIRITEHCAQNGEEGRWRDLAGFIHDTVKKWGGAGKNLTLFVQHSAAEEAGAGDVLLEVKMIQSCQSELSKFFTLRTGINTHFWPHAGTSKSRM